MEYFRMLHRNIKTWNTHHSHILHAPIHEQKLLVISDIHPYIYIVCAHKYDGYVQHKCQTYTIPAKMAEM